MACEIWVSRAGPPGEYEMLTPEREWIRIPAGTDPRGQADPTLLLPTDALDQLANEIARVRGQRKDESYLAGKLEAVDDSLQRERSLVDRFVTAAINRNEDDKSAS